MDDNETHSQDAVNAYSKIQYLAQNDMRRMLDEDIKSRRFTALNLPVHAHTGTDSVQVTYTDLVGAKYQGLIQTTTLSSAQILALNTTPIQLVPQPGALSVIIVDGITARITYSGTAYTGANALEFRYTDGSGAKVTADIPNTFINSAASAYYHAPAVATALVPVEGGSGNNGRIVVVVPTADPATGNSQITFTVKYRLVSFAF